jgi:hypothetical protein
MKHKATVPADWRPQHRQLEPGDVVEATTSDDGSKIDNVCVWRAGRPIPVPSLREAVDLIREHGRPDETHAASYIDKAMRGRLDDLALLIETRDAGQAPDNADNKVLEGLGFDLEGEDATEQAERLMDEYPLCAEATVVFEVVLGTGGPDDRLLFECSAGYEREADDPAQRTTWEIDRVLYRYSWTGSAERVLHGKDRETAEELARRVVPELVE